MLLQWVHLHLDVVLQGHCGLYKVLRLYEDKFALLYLTHCPLVHPHRHNGLLGWGRGWQGGGRKGGRRWGRGWGRGGAGHTGKRGGVSVRCKPHTHDLRKESLP